MSIEFLIKHMSLEEKASLMSGADFWHTKAVERLGIPAAMMSDGPHGLRKVVTTAKTPDGNSVPATCFPTASALANSWDEALVEQTGKLLGIEAANENVCMVLGPGLNIKRDPLCGRNFEYFSEDPFLAGKLAAAMVRGIQSEGLYACPKHFAANSQEHLRMTVDSVVDERTLREIYLPAFETAVKEGGAKCVMSSYNRLNGIYSSENEHLLRDILYGNWGFSGMVVTDWGANNDRVAGVKAGCTLEMPSCGGATDREIVEAVKAGRLEESVLDEQVKRLLEFVFSTSKAIGPRKFDMFKHHLFAARAAEETAVLLKNEDGILPLAPEKRVAVIGDFAFAPRIQGAGSSLVNAWNPLDPVDCLKKAGIKLSGAVRGFNRNGKRSSKLMKEAVALARESDAVLYYMGLEEGDEAEGLDRETIALPDNQVNLLKVLSEVNENIVVIISCGGVVDTSWDGCCKALVHGFLSGQAAPLAMAELLAGKKNFSGKLSETVPVRYEDGPASRWFPGREKTAEYREGIYVGYRYYETAEVPVKYPFGFGLSYTSFEYSDLKVSGKRVSFRVKNTGERAGAEVAQLYVSAKTGGMFRPSKELKGFKRIVLEPGEEKTVEMVLDERSFAVWNTVTGGWTVEPGKYSVLIGASCSDIRLGTEIVKEGDP
ncbi:MAG: glycoside hydrolase family 3 C-terminal domain-containing protein, partial [Oscillospiraceae bacterium]|nr:glycoside hydrolase family 3 C-terminal domain-containing protein [Oscillospiraceae bacterium]